MMTELVSQEFSSIYSIINLHRQRALQEVNNDSLLIAWNVGSFVSQKIASSEWGSSVVSELSDYLRTKDPSLKGYSRRTIYKMVQFYDTYSNPQFTAFLAQFKLNATYKLPAPIVPAQNEFVPFQMAQIALKGEIEIVPTLSAQFAPKEKNEIVPIQLAQFVQSQSEKMPEILFSTNWSNHQQILASCKLKEQRLFYMLYAKKEKLNVRELARAIKTNAYESVLGSRDFQSIALQNAYPDAKYLFKDTAYLDFLGLPDRYKESRLRKGIADHMKQFILELGKDFIFIGQEYPVEVGGKTFKIDLLFFHRALQCLVAVELKTTEFEPSFMGQLEFYLEALDQNERRTNENPSIGILLCKEANREVVKYALNRSMSPTMIAEYKEKLISEEVMQRTLTEFVSYIESGKRR